MESEKLCTVIDVANLAYALLVACIECKVRVRHHVDRRKIIISLPVSITSHICLILVYKYHAEVLYEDYAHVSQCKQFET
jgi:hypothetical protein